MTTFQPDTVPGQPPPPDSVHPRDSAPASPTSVSRLNDTIRGFIEKWGSVWVEGEITSWNVRGGNVFGRLKDGSTDATISFRLWSSTRQRLADDLAVGDHVIACVKADYFPRSGDFTFAVSAMRHVGLGDQLEKLERLRVALRAEGLFDPARKRTLPFLPHGGRPHHRREVRRREGCPPQRGAALAAGALPHRVRGGAGRPLRARDDRGARRRWTPTPRST